MKLLCSVFLCIFAGAASAFRYEEYKQFLEKQSKNATFVKLFEDHVKKFQRPQTKTEASLEFPCLPFKKSKIATTVHQLTPFDIKVVAAIGDSITAGTGITAATVIGLLREDRGLSWSGGGDGTVEEHITLPNMIKRYNPDVVGYSTGWGPYWLPNANLNVGNPGDEAKNMPFQARLLVDKMKSASGFDFQNDWKVITLFIGGNDLCGFCDDREAYTPEKYIGYIQEALDILHAEVPKALVNLVEVMNIGFVPLLSEGIICEAIHFFGCRCGAYPDESEKKELEELMLAYQKAVQDLIHTGRYDSRDDFTVVDQPFFSKTQVPKNEDGSADLSYFSPDCFHLSRKGQEVAAYALWDNMIEPVGQKRRSWSPGVPVECPDEQAPYFYTKKNSQQTPADMSLVVDDSPVKNDEQNQIESDATPGIVIALLCIIVIVLGTVYFFKKKASKKEDRILTGASPSYAHL